MSRVRPWACSSTAITSKWRARAGSSPAKQVSIVPNAPGSSTSAAPAPCRSWYSWSAPTSTYPEDVTASALPASCVRAVVEVDHAVLVHLTARERELAGRSGRREKPRALATCERKHENVQLVDQAVGEHRADQRVAATD